MKVIRFFAVFLVVAALVGWPIVARAETTVVTRSQLISQNCKIIHTLVDQLQRRDLVSRTNLGREYETVGKQLDAFNQRIRSNSLNNQAYQQLLAQFRDATTQFREAYVHYDDSINKLQGIDCQKQPDVFDAQLTASRNLRDAVEGTITRAGALVGQYRDMAAQLSTQLPQSTGVTQ